MAEPLDLIVIGTGTAGSGPAYRCRRAGWRVAVVDELPYGGTCALRGCDPKESARRRRGARGLAPSDAGPGSEWRRACLLAGADAVQTDLHGSRAGRSGEGVPESWDRDLSWARAVREPREAVG